MTKQDPTPPVPWWKHGHVWLVISGPAIVVVASLVTGWVAMRHQDPVLDADYYRHGVDINRTLAAHRRGELPAEQGRNHANTPADD